MCTIKRSIVLSFILLPCALAGSPKNAQSPSKKDSLYSAALFSSLSEMQKSWGYIDDSDGSTIRTDYQHAVVEEDPEITDGLPTQQGDYRVEYLDSQKQMDRYKKLRKSFAIIRIHPMQSNSLQLKILVSVSYLTYKHHRLLFGLSDWGDVEFRYDCKTQKFVVSSVKLGGI